MKIPKEIKLCEDLKTVVADADIVVMAVASPFVRSTAKEVASLGINNIQMVNVAKGIEEDSLMTMTAIIREEIPDVMIAILSGPSHAEEVSR